MLYFLCVAAEAAAPSGDSLLLNFSIPAKTIYKGQNVSSVIIPVSEPAPSQPQI